MKSEVKLKHIDHGSSRQREQRPPNDSVIVNGHDFYVFKVPPHKINMKMDCVDNFMVMQLGHARALASFNSDRLVPMQLGPGYPIMGLTGHEFNCKATSTAGVIGFHFSDDYLKNLFAGQKWNRQLDLNIKGPRFDLQLMQLFNLISRELKQPSQDLMYIEHLVSASILRSFSIYREGQIRHEKKVPMDRLLRAEEFIRENFNKPLSLEQIASVASLSMYHFGRSFKSHFGMSPYQYLQHVRLEKSIEFLETTHWPIECIAKELGFANHSNFAWFFKKHTGISPSAYRRLLN